MMYHSIGAVTVVLREIRDELKKLNKTLKTRSFVIPSMSEANDIPQVAPAEQNRCFHLWEGTTGGYICRNCKAVKPAVYPDRRTTDSEE